MQFITPDWPAPARVSTLTTCRDGGQSRGLYAGLNFAQHVGDDSSAVLANRAALRKELTLPSEPVWLEQIHGTSIVELDTLTTQKLPRADAAISKSADQVCAVMTADCLPVLMCSENGTVVAAVHAGWRGLLAGVIEQTAKKMGSSNKLLVWLGPAIGPGQFEVGEDVKTAFVNKQSNMAQAFQRVDSTHYLADLYALARMTLLACGVKKIYGGEHCTYNEPDLFYSYRREPVTGRMASLIWLQP